MKDSTYFEVECTDEDNRLYERIAGILNHSIKREVFLHCIYAVDNMLTEKYEDLEFNIEEDCAPTRFKLVIEDQSICHSIIVNNIDCTDIENI